MINEEELADLRAELDGLLHENEMISVENDLFDSFVKRNTMSAVIQQEVEEKKATAPSRHQKKTANKIPTSLTIEQKQDIASAELEEATKEIQDTKKTSERLIDTLRAVIEEADIRIAELKKDAYEFKRDIVVGAENFRTGKTMAEKVIRYMEDKLRAKDAVVEKLRLKNASLKTQAQKTDAQLRQKEEMGDVLHYIDFHQLQIENKQYVAKIEERNDELLKLKMTTGNTVQVLNNMKRKLNGLIEENTWLKSEIQTREDTNDKIKVETTKVQGEIAKDGKKLKKLQKTSDGANSSSNNATTTGMPNILDYVAQKAEMYELEKEVANIERKIEIAEMAVKTKQRQRRQRNSGQGGVLQK